VVSDRVADAWPDRQRGEELLELVHQEEAPAARHRPGHPQAAGAGGRTSNKQRRPRRLRSSQQPLGRVHRRRAHPLVCGPAHAAAGNGRRKLQRHVRPQHQRRLLRRRRVQRRVPVAVRVQLQPNCGGLGCRVPGPGSRSAVGVDLQHAELDGRPKPRGHHHHGRALQQQQQQQRARVHAELQRHGHRPPPDVAGAGHDEQLLYHRDRRRGPVRRGAGRAQVVRLRVRRVSAAGAVHLRGQRAVRRARRAQQLVLELSQRGRRRPPKSITIPYVPMDRPSSRRTTSTRSACAPATYHS
jgi:hypothetical protein